MAGLWSMLALSPHTWIVLGSLVLWIVIRGFGLTDRFFTGLPVVLPPTDVTLQQTFPIHPDALSKTARRKLERRLEREPFAVGQSVLEPGFFAGSLELSRLDTVLMLVALALLNSFFAELWSGYRAATSPAPASAAPVDPRSPASLSEFAPVITLISLLFVLVSVGQSALRQRKSELTTSSQRTVETVFTLAVTGCAAFAASLFFRWPSAAATLDLDLDSTAFAAAVDALRTRILALSPASPFNPTYLSLAALTVSAAALLSALLVPCALLAARLLHRLYTAPELAAAAVPPSSPSSSSSTAAAPAPAASVFWPALAWVLSLASVLAYSAPLARDALVSPESGFSYELFARLRALLLLAALLAHVRAVPALLHAHLLAPLALLRLRNEAVAAAATAAATAGTSAEKFVNLTPLPLWIRGFQAVAAEHILLAPRLALILLAPALLTALLLVFELRSGAAHVAGLSGFVAALVARLSGTPLPAAAAAATPTLSASASSEAALTEWTLTSNPLVHPMTGFLVLWCQGAWVALVALGVTMLRWEETLKKAIEVTKMSSSKLAPLPLPHERQQQQQQQQAQSPDEPAGLGDIAEKTPDSAHDHAHDHDPACSHASATPASASASASAS